MSVDTIDELMDEAVTQGMIAMQLSMGDGLPGRHDKVIKKTKAKLHSLLISKLPEKMKDRTGETPEGTTFHKADGSWVTANDFGYNSAIDDMKAVLAEMFRSGDE